MFCAIFNFQTRSRAYEKNTKGEMIANETHNEEAVLLFAFAGNGRGRKSD